MVDNFYFALEAWGTASFCMNKFTVNVPCVKYPVNKILFLTKASNFIFLCSVTSIAEVLTCEFNLKGVFRASDEILSFRWKLQEGLIWYNLLGCCYYTFLLGQSCRGTQIGSVIELIGYCANRFCCNANWLLPIMMHALKKWRTFLIVTETLKTQWYLRWIAPSDEKCIFFTIPSVCDKCMHVE